MTYRKTLAFALVSVLFWAPGALSSVVPSAPAALFAATSKTGTSTKADEDEVSQLQKRRDTLEFGLESEISDLISTLMKEEDWSLSDELYKAFEATANAVIREKIIDYFARAKDARLTDYALEILEDPYDTRKSTVNRLLFYVGECGVTDATPLIITLLDDENEDYLDAALTALGKIGGKEGAVFLSEYLERDLTTARRQNLMKSLGQLKAVETWDKLVEAARDEDENTFVRMYAIEAIGAMEKQESVPVLKELFESDDTNIRTYAVKGLSYYNTPEVEKVMVQAFRDNYYKVRLEAAAAVKKWGFKNALQSLLYRAKNDSETAVRNACFEAIGALDMKEGNDFLVSVVRDKKKGESARAKCAEVILENNSKEAVAAVLEVAKEAVGDDKLKNLRYAIGKALAKRESRDYEDVCAAFLSSKDAATQGIGLDIWKRNPYKALKEQVESIAGAEKQTSVTRKAKLVLEQTE